MSLRPQAPLWTLAAFPDVLVWLDKQQGELIASSGEEDEWANTTMQLFGIPSEDDEITNASGYLQARFYGNLVSNYVTRTGKRLEAAVPEGSNKDIYLAGTLLEATGQESTFTLLATTTTKYYIELRRGYASSFRDETALLAMAGILDAIAYILESQVKPVQIIQLARSTEGSDNRLVDFLVELEALLLFVDAPEFTFEEVSSICREHAATIDKSVRRTMDAYRGEPAIGACVRAMMSLPKFASLRQAVGVKPTSLLAKLKDRFFG